MVCGVYLQPLRCFLLSPEFLSSQSCPLSFHHLSTAWTIDLASVRGKESSTALGTHDGVLVYIFLQVFQNDISKTLPKKSFPLCFPDMEELLYQYVGQVIDVRFYLKKLLPHSPIDKVIIIFSVISRHAIVDGFAEFVIEIYQRPIFRCDLRVRVAHEHPVFELTE